MDDKKSTHFSLDELARQLAESVPQNLRVLGQDLERNFKTLLKAGHELHALEPRLEQRLEIPLEVLAEHSQVWRHRLGQLTRELVQAEVSRFLVVHCIPLREL